MPSSIIASANSRGREVPYVRKTARRAPDRKDRSHHEDHPLHHAGAQRRPGVPAASDGHGAHVRLYPRPGGEGAADQPHADHHGGLRAGGQQQPGDEPLHHEQAALRPEQLLGGLHHPAGAPPARRGGGGGEDQVRPYRHHLRRAGQDGRRRQRRPGGAGAGPRVHRQAPGLRVRGAGPGHGDRGAGEVPGPVRHLPQVPHRGAALPRGHVHHQHRLHRPPRGEPPHLQLRQRGPVLWHGHLGAGGRGGERDPSPEAVFAHRHHRRRAGLLRRPLRPVLRRHAPVSRSPGAAGGAPGIRPLRRGHGVPRAQAEEGIKHPFKGAAKPRLFLLTNSPRPD